MSNLAFLEAATQSSSAASIIESNESLINFATAEVDALVEEQALHTAWHVNEFIEENFSTTYENVKEPIEDLVAEATSIFADVIASDESNVDKKAMIEGYAHIIAMGNYDIISEDIFGSAMSGLSSLGDTAVKATKDLSNVDVNDVVNKATHAATHLQQQAKEFNALTPDQLRTKMTDGAQNVRDTVAANAGGLTRNQATVGGAAAGIAAGAVAGAGAGAGAAAFVKMFSKERKAWKHLVAQEKHLRSTGANANVLKKVAKAKMEAHNKYKKARAAAMKKGAKIGGAVGAVAGGVGGGVYAYRRNSIGYGM